MPGRHDAARRGRRHSARHALGQAHRRAAALGEERLAAVERQVEPALVRGGPLLRIPGEQGLQDAYPRALVQVPQLHRVPHLPWRAPQDRQPAVAHRDDGAGGCGAASCKALPAAGGEVEPCAAGGLAGAVSARPDADVAGQVAGVLRLFGSLPPWGRAGVGACRRTSPHPNLPPGGEGAERRPGAGPQTPARRDQHPYPLPLRGRYRLPHAGPPEPHAQRWRGAAHQPHDRARHFAGEHAVRARRAQHRTAPARHGAHQRRHAAPA
jgi:hypothetical protein